MSKFMPNKALTVIFLGLMVFWIASIINFLDYTIGIQMNLFPSRFPDFVTIFFLVITASFFSAYCLYLGIRNLKTEKTSTLSGNNKKKLNQKRALVWIMCLLLFSSPFITYAYVYEQQSNNIFQTILDSVANLFDFVDNNTSDVDGSADKGVHSNFTAQQYGPDSTYDTLTEEGFLGVNEYIWISGDNDFVSKHNKSDPSGTEILSWDTGTSYPFGIEYRFEYGNEYIYLVDKGSGVDSLIKFNANTGEELTRWSISGYSGDAEGLAWNSSRWFIADRSDDLIYQVDPANPTVAERSFSYSGISYCTGLAWDGSYLWATDEGSDTVYQIDIYGNIQTSWSFTDPTGIAYDIVSGHLWIVSGSTDSLYEYYTNGT